MGLIKKAPKGPPPPPPTTAELIVRHRKKAEELLAKAGNTIRIEESTKLSAAATAHATLANHYQHELLYPTVVQKVATVSEASTVTSTS